MEAVISKIYLTKIPFLSKSTILGSNKRYKKVQRPQNQFVWSNKKRRGSSSDEKCRGSEILIFYMDPRGENKTWKKEDPPTNPINLMGG